MALDVTIKDQNGKAVFAREKEYTIGDYWFEGGKQVPIKEWDITAMKHFDLGIKPHKPDVNTYIVHLPKGTKSVDVEANLIYEYTTGNRATMKKSTQKVDFVK